jgi:autoinducer 2-degrading protein
MESSFVVTVTFDVRSGKRDDFRRAILANASESLSLEPGCRTFDVCESAGSNEFFLYEIYDDEAAFKRHLTMDHFREFDTLSAGWVVDKCVLTYHRIDHPEHGDRP